MTKYCNPKRTRNIYDPADGKPFAISRSKLDLFLECPRCFHLDRRLGVGRPPGFPFNLNTAVDTLLKKEFDIHRAGGSRHPLLEKYGVDAVPIDHAELATWRENFKGVRFHHQPTNLVITGAIDDLWLDAQRRFVVVDYKATSKAEPITALDQGWHAGYKRQMEIYQWLLRRNGLEVSPTGYFVYCNGRTDLAAFDGKLEFDVTLIAYTGDDSWVEQAVRDAHACLNAPEIPAAAEECDYCAYVEAVRGLDSRSARTG
jgi:hypothetical protein